MKLFKRKDVRTEFLPSAIEIVETPASPLGKFSIWSICLVVIAALLWSIFSKVDEVAIARGKIIPSGNTNVVGSLTGGVIKSINVKEGQDVKEGDTLLTLDDSNFIAEKNKIENEMQALETAKNILTAYKNGETPEINVDALSISKELIKEQLGYYSSLDSINSNNLDNSDLDIKTSKEKLEKEEQNLAKAKEKLESLKNELKELKSSNQNSTVKDFDINTAETRIKSTTSEIESINSTIKSIEDTIKMKTNARDNIALDRKQKIEKELVDVINLIESHKIDIDKFNTRINELTIKSPVEGKIQQIAVNTIGGVVQGGAPLVHIVPLNKELVVEAMITNKDIGFVSEGQPVSVKFDTYDYQRYGTIDGTISQITPDAVIVNNEPMYKATINLEKKDITINDKTLKFSPGMTVTADIDIGQRRVIDFFIPGLKDIKNSFNLR